MHIPSIIRLLVSFTALALAFSACTSTGGTTTSSTAPLTTTVTEQSRDFYERGCGSHVSEGYGSEDNEHLNLHIGPIAFLAFDSDWLGENAADYFNPDSEGRYRGIKYVLVVDGDATGPVSVSIAGPDRNEVRLIYDPSRQRPTWEEADHTVKFWPCDGIDAQFNGGFIVREPTCATIIVNDEGRANTPEATAALPFGTQPDTCTAS